MSFQFLILLQTRRFRELRPNQSHRIVVTFAAVILPGKKFAEPRICSFGKRLDAALRPLQRQVMLPGGLISFRDLEIVVSERKITFLYSNDRLYIPRLAGKRIHNMRNPKSF